MPFEDNESRFESDIESFLLSPEGGYIKGTMTGYDVKKGLYLDTLISFLRTTQPKEWRRYERTYGSDTPKRLYSRFESEVTSQGLIFVLRNGIVDAGIKFSLCYFKPETTLNPDLLTLYNSNILICTRQFAYSDENNKTIDMVLSLNGIPIIALELKDQLKSQSVDNAKLQFMNNRDPRELIFNFNKRILAYFAVDLYEAWMTTQLKGKSTHFLPFNQGSGRAGHEGGAGNPTNPNGYATSYLWENVLQRDSLLNIIQRFISIELKEKVKIVDGQEKTIKKKTIIFPRYHQLDVVTKIVDDVRENGSGKNYLVQHSAGSGKSNSIAWLAYRLSSLHDEDRKPIFRSVIVVTDRKVLDAQLQDTISGFEHKRGVVESIGEGKTSQDLKNAINNGKKIIITTLQKFPIIYDQIDEHSGRNFAIIVDEAHSSQSGTSAKKLKTALADTEDALREFAEIEGKTEEEVKDDMDLLLEEILTHGKHKNLSFFAFTATPKAKTIELFGCKQSDGEYAPFHIYSMQQAIEEGFIHDVLKNYTTYQTFFKLNKTTPDNPTVEETPAIKALMEYQKSHDYVIAQKVAVIVEHFRNVTLKEIGGRAKAMVVTSSRAHAVKYYYETKKYIEKMGYEGIDILVAFSGIVKIGDVEYSEPGINKTKDGKKISEKQLRKVFETEEFNMLIVAEKYQTGFDEPMLHTMFVDKKLSGVKAVQTLSRLNRIAEGKNGTFVLDFVNTADEIQESFEPYYKATYLSHEIDVNLVYDLMLKIREYNIYNKDDIEKLADIRISTSVTQDNRALGKATSIIKPVIGEYNKLSEEERYKFRDLLVKFNRTYSYVTQIKRMFDKDLHKEYLFTSYLITLIPKGKNTSVIVEDKILLEYNMLKETFSGQISLNPEGKGGMINPPSDAEGRKPKKAKTLLEIIIEKINDIYQGKFTDADKVIITGMYEKFTNDADYKKYKKYARNNNADVFEKGIFPEAFNKIAQACYMESMESFSKLFENKEFYAKVMEEMGKEIYKELRNKE